MRTRITIGRRTPRRAAGSLAALLALAVSILPVSRAGADGAPFADTKVEAWSQPDPLLSFGSASATAGAETDGDLSVSATAAELFPVRTATSSGRSEAKAQAAIVHTFAATPGRWEVSATLSPSSPTAQASAPLPVLTRGEASVAAKLGAGVAACAAEPSSCVPTYAPGSQAEVRRRIACAPASAGCGGAPPVELSVIVDVAAPAHIYVEVTLEASALAEGMSSAAAQADATVTDISAAPAPPPTPFAPVFPLAPRVLVDTVAVDAGGTPATAHVALSRTRAFVIEARGPYRYGAPNVLADAECAQAGGGWTNDPVPSQPESLDVLMNDLPVPWTPEFGSARTEAPACSASHTYQVGMVGGDAKPIFHVADPTPNDNVGMIVVAIYALVP